jgi:outer membrane immunogenic protein
MNVRFQGMLATTAAAAALLASADLVRADGMPAPAYARPASWTGAYIGVESGWDWDRVHNAYPLLGTSANSTRDGINGGLFAGYQQQFGSIVLGVEVNLIGNEFDIHRNVTGAAGSVGNCPNPAFNCVGRITNEITVGPRLGLAMGHWMPYVTGGWATGSINWRGIPVGGNGVATEWADARSDGYFIGGGLDWKLAPNAVLGVEYRHTDLGTVHTTDFNPTNGAVVYPSQAFTLRGTSDAVLFRGSLLFGGRDYAPLK